MLLDLMRYAARRVLRSPGYAIPVVASLGLGLGANTAVFSELEHALRHPLPFADGDRLVALGLTVSRGAPGPGTSQAPRWDIPGIDLDAWTSGARSLQSLAVYTQYPALVAGNTRAEYLAGASASADLLGVLTLQPERGRWFTPEEARARVVVLSHPLWLRQFGGDDRVLGQVLRIQGEPWTVIGVMPPGLTLPVDAAFWVPLRGPNGWVVGRLKPGVTPEQVAQELQAISPSVANQKRYGYSERIIVTSLHDRLFGTATPPLALLLGASVLFLLITCTNVASLTLARTLERRRELAVRMALGASRVALTTTIVAENVLLALLGAAVGGVIALWGLNVVMALAPEEIARIGPPRFNGLTVTFGLASAVAAALLVSAAPVLIVGDTRVHRLLGHMGSPGSLDRVKPTMRRPLAAVQIASAMVLITGAGLLIRSIGRLTRSDHLGFSPRGVVIAAIPTLGTVYQESRHAFVQALVERVRAGRGGLSIGPRSACAAVLTPAAVAAKLLTHSELPVFAMPTYHYRCPSCGHDFEKFEKINVKARPKCPECGTRAERQISGGAGLLFKGSGFYATDYKRPQGGEKSADSGTAAKSDAAGKSEKPETKKPSKSSGAE